MINPFCNNGTTFHICPNLPSAYSEIGFASLTYTKIRGIASTGDIGEEYETFVSNAIGGVKHTKKTGKSALSLNVSMIKIDDAGQDLMKALYNTTASYSFKVVLPDSTVYYFTANCSSRSSNATQSNQINTTSSTLNIDSELLEV